MSRRQSSGPQPITMDEWMAELNRFTSSTCVHDSESKTLHEVMDSLGLSRHLASKFLADGLKKGTLVRTRKYVIDGNGVRNLRSSYKLVAAKPLPK